MVTARETLGLVTARWQEIVKNGSTVPIDEYPVSDEISENDDWDWGTLDLADVLRRWGAGLPPERVHVLTLPKPDEPRDTLWLRFASLLGVDPASVDPSRSAQNESLGVVEVELLRRVNADLTGFGVRPRPRQLDPWLPRDRASSCRAAGSGSGPRPSGWPSCVSAVSGSPTRSPPPGTT